MRKSSGEYLKGEAASTELGSLQFNKIVQLLQDKYNEREIATELKKNPSLFSQTDEDGHPLIFHAIVNGRDAIVSYLVTQKVETELVDEDRQRSIFHLAVKHNQIEVATVLLKNGIGFNESNIEDLIDIVVEFKRVEFVDFLIASGLLEKITQEQFKHLLTLSRNSDPQNIADRLALSALKYKREDLLPCFLEKDYGNISFLLAASFNPDKTAELIDRRIQGNTLQSILQFVPIERINAYLSKKSNNEKKLWNKESLDELSGELLDIIQRHMKMETENFTRGKDNNLPALKFLAKHHQGQALFKELSSIGVKFLLKNKRYKDLRAYLRFIISIGGNHKLDLNKIVTDVIRNDALPLSLRCSFAKQLFQLGHVFEYKFFFEGELDNFLKETVNELISAESKKEIMAFIKDFIDSFYVNPLFDTSDDPFGNSINCSSPATAEKIIFVLERLGDEVNVLKICENFVDRIKNEKQRKLIQKEIASCHERIPLRRLLDELNDPIIKDVDQTKDKIKKTMDQLLENKKQKARGLGSYESATMFSDRPLPGYSSSLFHSKSPNYDISKELLEFIILTLEELKDYRYANDIYHKIKSSITTYGCSTILKEAIDRNSEALRAQQERSRYIKGLLQTQLNSEANAYLENGSQDNYYVHSFSS